VIGEPEELKILRGFRVESEINTLCLHQNNLVVASEREVDGRLVEHESPRLSFTGANEDDPCERFRRPCPILAGFAWLRQLQLQREATAGIFDLWTVERQCSNPLSLECLFDVVAREEQGPELNGEFSGALSAKNLRSRARQN